MPSDEFEFLLTDLVANFSYEGESGVLKMAAGTTLNRHLGEEGSWRKDGGGDLLALLEPIALAGKILAREVDQAALAGKLGLAGDQNATGDMQKKLDVIGNEIVMDAFASCERGGRASRRRSWTRPW